MLEFKKRTLGVKFEGKLHELKFPNTLQMNEYQKKVKEIKEDEYIPVIMNFLEKLGLPKSVSGEFELQQLQKVMEELTGAKKK
jgi:hypothetical protein